MLIHDLSHSWASDILVVSGAQEAFCSRPDCLYTPLNLKGCSQLVQLDKAVLRCESMQPMTRSALSCDDHVYHSLSNLMEFGINNPGVFSTYCYPINPGYALSCMVG